MRYVTTPLTWWFVGCLALFLAFITRNGELGTQATVCLAASAILAKKP